MRILAIVNLFGLGTSRRNASRVLENGHLYIPDDSAWKNLAGWELQRLDADIDIVYSCCRCSQGFRTTLAEKLSKCIRPGLDFRIISFDNLYPVRTTFNLAVMASRKTQSYDYYIYNAGDCYLTKPWMLSEIMGGFSSDDVGQVTEMVDKDHCPHCFRKLFKRGRRGKEYVDIPLGQYVNNHFTVFSSRLMEQSVHRMIYVFASCGMEPFMTFWNFANGLRWRLCRSVSLRHEEAHIHGQKKWEFVNGDSFAALSADGRPYGLGWPGGKVCKRYAYPFSLKVASDRRDRLRTFLASRLFLKPEEFDYGSAEYSLEWGF